MVTIVYQKCDVKLVVFSKIVNVGMNENIGILFSVSEKIKLKFKKNNIYLI